MQVEIRCHALDLSGIVGTHHTLTIPYLQPLTNSVSSPVLTVGSIIASLHYGYLCSPSTKLTYTTAILVAGLGAAFIVLDPEYSKPTHRGARTSVFILLGLSAVVPVVHALRTRSVGVLREQMGVGYVVLEAGLYIGGALL